MTGKDGVETAVDTSTKSVSIQGSTETSTKRRPSKRLSRGQSSFFQKLSMSFRRSGGERGADVDTLRGTHGPDFEGYAVVTRGDVGGCGCFGGGQDMKEKLILVKGPFIFVFNREQDAAPKYAISLVHLKASRKAAGGLVMLETNLGDVEYEFSFTDDNIAKQFADASRQQAAVGEAQQIKKRLGHEHLLTKRKSVLFAEKVAMKKMENQPDKPERLTSADIASMPGPVGGI